LHLLHRLTLQSGRGEVVSRRLSLPTDVILYSATFDTYPQTALFYKKSSYQLMELFLM